MTPLLLMDGKDKMQKKSSGPSF